MTRLMDVRWSPAGLALVLALTLACAGTRAHAETPPAAEAAPTPDASAPSPNPLIEDAAELESRIATLREKIDELDALVAKAEGEDKLVLENQVWQLRLEGHAAIGALARNLVRQEKAGLDAEPLRKRLVTSLAPSFPNYLRHLDRRRAHARALREEREGAEGTRYLALTQRSAEAEKQLQRMYLAVLEAIEYREMIGLDGKEQREEAAERISERAEKVSGRMELARNELDLGRAQLAENPDDPQLKLLLKGLEVRFDETIDSMTATIALMAELDLETVRYQQLLIRTTGEVSLDLLSREVLLGLFRDWTEQAREAARRNGPVWAFRVMLFVLVLLGFWVGSLLTRRLMLRGVRSRHVEMSRLLQETLILWSSRVVMAIGVLVALSQLGIQIGPMLAGLGIAGFILGFALQETLSSFAAGAMILIYQPFDVGDVIEAAGVSGKVREMTLISTTILTFDNQTLIVPNQKIWGDVIRNVTAQQTRRVDLVVRVDYREDVDRVETVLRDVMGRHAHVLDDPPPAIKVLKIGEAGVEVAYRPWCRTEHYWDVYWDLTRDVVARFDRENIAIALPQRSVRLVRDGETEPTRTT